ncbi:MAG TPA: amino acid permease [Blastocatellia bacterium]|nr:amino acid permease [Blastocatellia bacterium]
MIDNNTLEVRQEVQGRTSVSPVELRRDIRRWDLVALLINVTVGAGILRLPSQVYKEAGAYSLPAFLICAAIIGLIVLCFAEVASRFSGTGGPYLYAHEAFGAAPAFMVGWLMWLTRLSGFATLTAVFVEYLGYFWPGAAVGWWRAIVITGIVVSLTVINVVGVRESAITSTVLTVAKLIPLLLFVLVGVFFIRPGQFSFAARPTFRPFSAAVFMLVYVFSGFEAVLVNSGEVREPSRNIPFALSLALGFSVLLFISIQVVCMGTLPGLGSSTRPLADASSRFLGGIGPEIISAGALAALLGTLHVVMLACSRLPFAMAERGALPRILLRTHRRFQTPYVSILVSAALVLALSLSGTFIYLLTLSVITRVLVYGATCAALPVLRRRRTSLPASFEAPAGSLVSTVSVLLCIGLLFSSGWREGRDVAISGAIGLVLYLVVQYRRSIET